MHFFTPCEFIVLYVGTWPRKRWGKSQNKRQQWEESDCCWWKSGFVVACCLFFLFTFNLLDLKAWFHLMKLLSSLGSIARHFSTKVCWTVGQSFDSQMNAPRHKKGLDHQEGISAWRIHYIQLNSIELKCREKTRDKVCEKRMRKWKERGAFIRLDPRCIFLLN